MDNYKKAAYVFVSELAWMWHPDTRTDNWRRTDYYATIKDDPELHVKLSGSWEVVVGEQDTFSASPNCDSIALTLTVL